MSYKSDQRDMTIDGASSAFIIFAALGGTFCLAQYVGLWDWHPAALYWPFVISVGSLFALFDAVIHKEED